MISKIDIYMKLWSICLALDTVTSRIIRFIAEKIIYIQLSGYFEQKVTELMKKEKGK